MKLKAITTLVYIHIHTCIIIHLEPYSEGGKRFFVDAEEIFTISTIFDSYGTLEGFEMAKLWKQPERS